MGNLNELLAKAKVAQSEWSKQSAYEQFRSLDKLMDAHKAWRSLTDAMERSLPVNFIGEDGQQRTIGTMCACSSELMQYYSESVGVQHCETAYKLTKIREFVGHEP